MKTKKAMFKIVEKLNKIFIITGFLGGCFFAGKFIVQSFLTGNYASFKAVLQAMMTTCYPLWICLGLIALSFILGCFVEYPLEKYIKLNDEFNICPWVFNKEKQKYNATQDNPYDFYAEVPKNCRCPKCKRRIYVVKQVTNEV